MAQEDAAGVSPAAGARRITLRLLLIVAASAALDALFGAHNWAAPRGGGSLGLSAVDLVLTALPAGAFLRGLDRSRLLVVALPALPSWAVAVARRAAQFVAGGWAGGWALGAAGAA